MAECICHSWHALCGLDANFQNLLSDPINRIVTNGCLNISDISRNSIRKRNDLKTSHEEADIIIIQQVLHAAKNGSKMIKVICDDTDVFILLLNFVDQEGAG